MNITFNNVSFKYIDKLLLDKVSFTITNKDKIGLIGVNGAGKSTILKLILNIEKPIEGQINITGGMKINYLPQDVSYQNGLKAIDIVLANSTKEHIINDYEAKSILTKFKIEPETLVDNLSGGELKRISLASALVSYSDLLILDEPTNHLDNEMIIWLEKYLIKYNKGLLMVTHDRYFLERICNKILELDFLKTYLYDANYSKFLEYKAERILSEERAKKKLKSILKDEYKWLNRGAEARRTKSKNRIERIHELEKTEFNERETFELNSISTRLGHKLIEITNGTKYYNDKLIFKDFSFKLEREDIIGIVGPNGAGKSTLFKIISQEEKLTTGNIEFGETLNIGYFKQNLDIIDENIRVIDYIKEENNIIETIDGKISAKEFLENFLFDSQMQYSLISKLSGGEKRRLQLIKILIKNPNILILDEPTNDLDIYTLEILEDYILNFKGPVLIVSHDRYFLDKLCNKLYVFEDNHINYYQVSFSDYLALDKSKVKDVKNINTKPKSIKLTSKQRNDLIELPKQIDQIENELIKLNNELKTLTTEYTLIIDITNKINVLENQLDEKINELFILEELKDSLQ